MEHFDKQNLKELRKRVNEALDEVGKSMGVTFRMKNIRYGDTDCHFKTECRIAGVKTKEERDYEFRQEANDGLPPMGEEFVMSHKVYKAVGWNRRATTYPVIVEEVETGIKYTVGEGVVKEAWGLKKAA